MGSFIGKVVSCVLLGVSSVYVSAATVMPNPNGAGNIVFQPTNPDIDILSVTDSNVAWDYTLYIFDDSADISQYDPNSPSFVNDGSILSVDPVPTQINFSHLLATHQTSGDTLNLSNNNHFIFALWNHNYQGGAWIEATAAEPFSSGIPDIFNIVFAFDNPNSGNNETVVLAVDIVPVPIPGALIFFASGLLGLFGFKRFKQK